MLHHDDGEIEGAHQHRGITHPEDRRRIKKDNIEAVLDLSDEVHHALRVEHADRIIRQLAAGQEEQIREIGGLHHILQIDIGGEKIGQAEIATQAVQAVLRRTTQVGVDNERVVAALGESVSKVGQGGRFAFARAAADKGDGIGIRRLPVEFEVGAQDPVGFGIGRGLGVRVEHADIFRHDGENRDLQEILHVFHRLHARVEVFEEEGEADPDNQADHHGEGHVEQNLRLGGCRGGFGDFPDAGRTHRHTALHGLGGETQLRRFEHPFRLDVAVLGAPVFRAAGFGLALFESGRFQFLLHLAHGTLGDLQVGGQGAADAVDLFGKLLLVGRFLGREGENRRVPWTEAGLQRTR